MQRISRLLDYGSPPTVVVWFAVRRLVWHLRVACYFWSSSAPGAGEPLASIHHPFPRAIRRPWLQYALRSKWLALFDAWVALQWGSSCAQPTPASVQKELRFSEPLCSASREWMASRRQSISLAFADWCASQGPISRRSATTARRRRSLTRPKWHVRPTWPTACRPNWCAKPKPARPRPRLAVQVDASDSRPASAGPAPSYNSFRVTPGQVARAERSDGYEHRSSAVRLLRRSRRGLAQGSFANAGPGECYVSSR